MSGPWIWVLTGVVALVALILACMVTSLSFRCIACMFGRDRKKRMRAAYGAGAVLSLVGLFAVAALGFAGLGRLLMH
jgi:hypothetical protein